MKKKHVKSNEATDIQELKKDTRRLVRALEAVGLQQFIVYLQSPWRIVWANFLGGVFRGLGIIVGMTIVLALLIWALGKVVDFPLIGSYFSDIKNLLEGFQLGNGFNAGFGK